MKSNSRRNLSSDFRRIALLHVRTRAIDVLTAGNPAEGDQRMSNAIDESAIPEAFRDPSQEQKTEQKPRQANQQRERGAAKAKSGKKIFAHAPPFATEPFHRRAKSMTSASPCHGVAGTLRVRRLGSSARS
jgi:hypothetical protein